MRTLSAVIPFLLWIGNAYAQSLPAEPPVESGGVGLVIFGILFIGFCVGIGWIIWKGQ